MNDNDIKFDIELLRLHMAIVKAERKLVDHVNCSLAPYGIKPFKTSINIDHVLFVFKVDMAK